MFIYFFLVLNQLYYTAGKECKIDYDGSAFMPGKRRKVEEK